MGPQISLSFCNVDKNVAHKRVSEKTDLVDRTYFSLQDFGFSSTAETNFDHSSILSRSNIMRITFVQ